MSTLPKGWTMTSLGAICERLVDGSHNPPKGVDVGLPMISARNIQGRNIYFDGCRYLSETDFEAENKRTAIRAGDVLLTIVGSIGRTAVVSEGILPFTLQRSVAVLRSPIATGQYLSYLLESVSVQEQLLANARGNAQKGIYLKELSKVAVPLAPLVEQKRITDKLDAALSRVDAARARLGRVPALLKRFRQAVLAAATSGALTEDWREERGLDEKWERVSVADVADEFSYGTSAKSSKTGLIPVLRMGNIQDGQLDWDDLVFTSNVDEIGKYRLVSGDVLFNRTNSPELVGKTAVFKGECEAIYAGYLIRVRCSSRLLPDFINYCLNSPAGRDYCWRVKSDGVSQSNINAKKLAAFEFDLPSVDEQREIIRRAESLFAIADRVQAQYERTFDRLSKLTPALLAKAFRGELVAQDPDDVPADQLLSGVKAPVKTVRGARKRAGALAN
ncbi:restriction endonuclease subunit S [Burkholderia cenocepacia]|uniref:restriction endonuclease subunit S n=1 Tax=Burkholderia cenocepacia TaxID=95486 RepID=UPI002874F799|nr:restriction endonuclease subunit S [Burkholderia cenocepacia]MDS0848581.1 restriction endonuclease subunit S [Burkholderia cenocepacia]